MQPKDNRGIIADLITEAELANQLGRSVRTLKRWRAQRIGPPYIRLGREVRYRRDAVRSWLMANEREQPRARGRD